MAGWTGRSGAGRLLSAALGLGALIGTLAATAPPGLAQGATDEVAALRKRVAQLEEQIVDMQVVIGTLETLARSGGGAPAPAAGGGFGGGSVDAARLDGMETQIRALTAQIEQLSAELGGGRRGDAGGLGGGRSALAEAPQAGRASDAGFGGFGSTTVTPGGGADPIGGFLSGDGGFGGGRDVAALSPGGEDPKQLYETAYGYLLQQDYGAAEAAFSDFLARHPSDQLAANAQYWLGETHFVRGAYKPAASAFLKHYERYGTSPKAPDSLLKLAMSLERLGQKEAACSSYGELASRFPDAPAHVKQRAASERRRAGC